MAQTSPRRSPLRSVTEQRSAVIPVYLELQVHGVDPEAPGARLQIHQLGDPAGGLLDLPELQREIAQSGLIGNAILMCSTTCHARNSAASRKNARSNHSSRAIRNGLLVADGTRSGGGQEETVRRMADAGVNAFHCQMFRMQVCNIKGEGDDTHGPFVDHDPSMPLNLDVLEQWDGWLAQMEKNATGRP